MRTRKKYDTGIIFLYNTGREHLLPLRFRRKIPYTTIAGWRRTDFRNYLGHEFRYFLEDAIEKAERIEELNNFIKKEFEKISKLFNNQNYHETQRQIRQLLKEQNMKKH